MSVESNLSSISAEVALKREIRQAKLLEKAKGRGLISWLDFAFVLPVVLFAYVALSGGERLQRETLAMCAALIMVVQWSIVRLSLRLNCLIQYLIEQPVTHEAQQGAPEGRAASGARPELTR